MEFSTSKADVAAYCAARARAARPCIHQYSLALLGCSVEVQCLALRHAPSSEQGSTGMHRANLKCDDVDR